MREIELAVERLAEWMKDESGVRDTPLGFKLNNPRIKKQPKGVGLIISPWNYPWFLVLGPMTGALAAGCPFVIKVSIAFPDTVQVTHGQSRYAAFRALQGFLSPPCSTRAQVPRPRGSSRLPRCRKPLDQSLGETMGPHLLCRVHQCRPHCRHGGCQEPGLVYARIGRQVAGDYCRRR